MNYLLDTCTISDFFKKTPSVIDRFKQISPQQLYVSTITVMEIEYGLKLNNERAQKIRPIWDPFLQAITLLSFTQQSAIFAASIRSHLKEQGLPIGPYDILLAGSALEHELIFVTSNTKEFLRVPELQIENWRVTE